MADHSECPTEGDQPLTPRNLPLWRPGTLSSILILPRVQACEGWPLARFYISQTSKCQSHSWAVTEVSKTSTPK